jgi:hypothetical protein
VDIVAVGCMASECATDAKHFVVRVSDNTEYRHARPQARNCIERTDSPLL